MNVRLPIAVVLVALATLWLLRESALPPAAVGTTSQQGASPDAPAAQPDRALDATMRAELPADATSASPPTADRIVAAASAEDGFTSESEQRGVVAEPVRDGLAILVLGEDRVPRANAALEVHWRKGFGDYGNDRGTTDARGRFATTVAEFEMLEGVVLHDPVLGELSSWFDFLPMANDPRTVLVLVPDLQPVTVRVVDQRGVPVAGATVACERGTGESAPREFVLAPADAERAAGDDGRVVLHVPVGLHTLAAKAAGHQPMYTLRASVPRGGTALTMHMLGRQDHHEVAVTVIAPDDLAAPVQVGGWSEHVPPSLPGLASEGVVPVQRQFEGRRLDARRFVVTVPVMPWRLTARADGCDWSWLDLGAADTAVTIELKRVPVRAEAKLRCRVLLPDGTPTFGEVVVHTAAEPLRGSRQLVREREPFIIVPAGGKGCVSVWRTEYAPTFIGPIELTAGEQEVVLQLQQPQVVRGRVVDEAGQPVAATVNLRRPAGPLRLLQPELPAILAETFSGDSFTTADDGAFRFLELGPGEHELWVQPVTTGWPSRVRITPGDEHAVVRLGVGVDDLARIQGRVTMAGTGEPVAGARVTWRSEAWQGSSYTDAAGRYAVAARPGVLHVEVMARRCAFHQGEPMEFRLGLSTANLALMPSDPLFVQVRGSDGKVPKVEISAFDAMGRAIPFLDAYGNYDGDVVDVDDSGRAKLGGLPAAGVRLHLQGEDEGVAMDVEVPSTLRREVVFEILWQPKPKAESQPKAEKPK